MTYVASSPAAGSGNTLASGGDLKPYILSSQESLASVASRTGLSQQQLLAINPHIAIPELIGPGDTLIVPASVMDSWDDGLVDTHLQSAIASETSTEPTVVVTPDPELPPDPWPGPGSPPIDPGPGPEPGDPGGGGGIGDPGGPSEPGEPEPTELPAVIVTANLGEPMLAIIREWPQHSIEWLEATLESGVQIVFSDRARFEPLEGENGVIHLNASATPERSIADLMHEIVHTAVRTYDTSSREAYIASGIGNEAWAQMHVLGLQRDLKAKGIDIPMTTSNADNIARYETLANQVHASEITIEQFFAGMNDIVRNHEVADLNGTTYEEFYGGHWDREIDPNRP